MSRIFYSFVFLFSFSANAAVDWQKKVEDFNFKEAEIHKVIEEVGKLTGKNYIVPSDVKGKISIINSKPITLEQAYDAFLASLALNRFTIVEAGAHEIITSSRGSQRDNLPIYVNERPPMKYRMYQMMYQFKHISAEEVSKSLRVLPSRDGELVSFRDTNHLIMSDFGPNLNRVWNLLEKLDQPPKGNKRRKRK